MFPSSVITELIIGYVLPGRPVAMMLFKTWGYITMAQGRVVYSPIRAFEFAEFLFGSSVDLFIRF